MALTISAVCSTVSGPSGPSSRSSTLEPSRINSLPRKRVSASRGMLVSRSGSAVSRLAAISLMAEFLAPEMGISPSSRAPPVTTMRSMAPLACGGRADSLRRSCQSRPCDPRRSAAQAGMRRSFSG